MYIIIKCDILLIITSLIVIKALTGFRTLRIMTHDASCGVIIIKAYLCECMRQLDVEHSSDVFFFHSRPECDTLEHRFSARIEVFESARLMQKKNEEKNRWKL